MDYSFKPIGRTCAATGGELTPGAVCRSALVERDGRLERFDYLQAAWPGPPEGTVGHWRTLVPKSHARPRKVDAEELFARFESLEESGHERVRRLRYVLALLLLQKKRLELEDTRGDGEVDYLILSGTKGEGPFEVRNEELEPATIAEIQSALLAELAAAPQGQDS